MLPDTLVLSGSALTPTYPSGPQDRFLRMFPPWLTFNGLHPVIRGDRGTLQGPSCHTSDAVQFNHALDTFSDMDVSD